MAIALQCVPPAVAPIMVGIAQHESRLDPTAIHHNPNGTVDVGIAQVNSANFSWLGLTMETALDPCRNFAAGAKVLFARYNGNPPDAGKALYAAQVMAQMPASTELTAEVPGCPKPDSDDDGWHTAAVPPGCLVDDDSPTPKEASEDANDDH